MFAVVRHPDIAGLGICPEGALELQRTRGWYRVSEWRAEPAQFHLPDFADADVDLDAEPELVKPKAAKAAKKTDVDTEEHQS